MKKVKMSALKPGDFFTYHGILYQKDSDESSDTANCLTGKYRGEVHYWFDERHNLTPVKIKIMEVS